VADGYGEVAVVHDGKFPDGLHICECHSRKLPPNLPLLRAVLEQLRKSPGVRVFIEIKQHGHPWQTYQPTLCEKVLDLCTHTCMKSRVAWFNMAGNSVLHKASAARGDDAIPIVSSRLQATLVRALFFSGLLPLVPNRWLPGILLVRADRPSLWQRAVIQHLQRRGHVVGALQVNDEAALSACSAIGTNFAASDDPDWLVKQPGWGPGNSKH